MCKLAGRPNKAGLDYFELDCHMEEKVRLIQAEFGYKSFAIVVKLYQRIYGGFGYYCEWNEDSLLLFMSELGVSSCDEKNYIREVVAACIRRNIFSAEIFKKYGVLTSVGVQKRYFAAVSRRESVELKKEYLLLNDGKIPNNVVINSIIADRNTVNTDKNSQSRVEKSREDKNTMCKADALALFERLWQLYPVKKGKGQVSDARKMKLFKIGFDEMERAINRYLAELKKESWRKPQNGSTFFNSGYVDYLDANYVPGPSEGRRKGNKPGFCDFPQDEYAYDYDAIEQSNMASVSAFERG